VIVGLVATLPFWFGFTEKVFLAVANTVHEGYTEHPMRTAVQAAREGQRRQRERLQPAANRGIALSGVSLRRR
jgi:hypothetical protein